MNKKNSRRSFLKLSLGVAAFSSLPRQLAWANDPAVALDESISAQPYLQSHFDNSMLVSWRSPLPSAVYVAYGEAPDQLNQKAYPAFNLGLQEANKTLHQVYLKDLKPGKTYFGV